MPKADFPSYVGIIEEYADKVESMDISTNGGQNGDIIRSSEGERKANKKYLLDALSVRAPKPHMQVQSFVKDGHIEDWDLFEKVLDYTFSKHLVCDPSKHPILFTEPVVSHLVFTKKINFLIIFPL